MGKIQGAAVKLMIALKPSMSITKLLKKEELPKFLKDMVLIQ